jgi:hypothetical protein
MTDGELLEILDKTFHVDSNGFVHYQSAKAWIHYGQLVAEAEREACAKVCDGIRYSGYCPPEDGSAPDYYNEATQECAEAIRARGKK